MYQVTKRDGKITDFHLKKIVAAITKAFEAQEKSDPSGYYRHACIKSDGGF